jgi:hypothetical protein
VNVSTDKRSIEYGDDADTIASNEHLGHYLLRDMDQIAIADPRNIDGAVFDAEIHRSNIRTPVEYIEARRQ